MTHGQRHRLVEATAGPILGAYFGPEGLEARWLAPFHDDLRTGLARFWGALTGRMRSLEEVARRMQELPEQIAEEVAQARQGK